MEESGAPSNYKTAGLLMVISSVFTLVVSAGYIISFILTCFGVIFIPWFFVPIGLAIYELTGAVKAQSGTRHSGIRTNAIFGLIAALTACNIISLVLDIIALILLGNEDVDEYLRG